MGEYGHFILQYFGSLVRLKYATGWVSSRPSLKRSNGLHQVMMELLTGTIKPIRNQIDIRSLRDAFQLANEVVLINESDTQRHSLLSAGYWRHLGKRYFSVANI